jgi:hypothetical protein
MQEILEQIVAQRIAGVTIRQVAGSSQQREAIACSCPNQPFTFQSFPLMSLKQPVMQAK